MNIAMAIERMAPTGSGVEAAAWALARGLVERGQHVTILTGEAPCHLELPGGRIISGDTVNIKHRVKVGRFVRWVAPMLRGGDYDAALSMTPTVAAAVVEPPAGTFAELIERRRAAGLESKRPWRRFVRDRFAVALALERRAMNDPSVRRFIAVSDYAADQFRRHYGIADERIALVPNGSRLSPPTPRQREEYRVQVRRSFNVPENATVFLFAAYDPALKGAAALLRAASWLQDKRKGFVVLMAGVVSFADQQLAATLDVRDRVRFVGPTAAMDALYCAADVTVRPTYYDAASALVLDSLVMGVPVITTGFDGASSLLFAPDGEARGRLVADPADTQGLCEAMAQLMSPAARDRCRQAALGLAEQLAFTHHVAGVEAVLKEAAPVR